jgi:succinyl-CoA synthetase alpha subunit
MINPDTFAPGTLAVVSKPGSSHDGYTVKIISITGTGASYRVSLGNNAVRTYYTENLKPLAD